MTHPFALVYAFQLAIWALLVARGWQRLWCPMVLVVGSILVAGLWVPLIALHPEAFEVQFKNQFLGGHDEGILMRALIPWKSLWYHSFFEFGMFHHIGPWQWFLAVVPTIGCLAMPSLRRSPQAIFALLAVSSFYIMSVLVGPHHPVIGYWSYTAALMFLCVGAWVQWFLERSQLWFGSSSLRRAVHAALAVLLLLSMVPGSGVKTLYAHLSHWNDIDFDSPRFARELAKEIPEGAVVAVDTQFLLDFLPLERKVLLAQTLPIYFRLDETPFDYLIVSRSGLETKIVVRLSVELVSVHGKKENEFACYAEVYRARMKGIPIMEPNQSQQAIAIGRDQRPQESEGR